MIRVLEGDCLDLLRTLPADSLDGCVTDPPYHLTTGKRGGSGPASSSSRTPQGRARIGTGFMGKAWDGGDVAFRPETWAEVLRVLKPGAHLLVFGATRTYHRLGVAIDDAGFEIRDCIRSEGDAAASAATLGAASLGWLYGCGMPKSHDIAKAIDREGGTPGTYGAPKSAVHARWIERGEMRGADGDDGWQRPWMDDPEKVANAARVYIPGSADAARWQGWGTALKPSWEPICIARKPFRGTVAANMLRHGTGALNIEACRIPYDGAADELESKGKNRHADFGSGPRTNRTFSADNRDRGEAGNYDPPGRWPANVVHDGSDAVLEAFAAFGKDSPARFFYSGKAKAGDRAGSEHPTVKPVPLLQHLLRLVIQPGGQVLDPFAGSGTLGAAALREGLDAVLIERDPAFAADCRRRFSTFAVQEAA